MSTNHEDFSTPTHSSYVVGITGASGSGKTSFAHRLCTAFAPDEICIVSQDNYYKPFEHQQPDPNGVVNFDLPESFHLKDYASDIRALRDGKTVRIQEYNFNNKNNPISTSFELKSAPIIIVEGLFIFHAQELWELFDLKVFVDVEDHIRLKRRILRDNEERGHSLDDVLYRYEFHVSPSYQKYIAPYKFESDMIIPNNRNFDKGLEVLVAFLKSKL